MKHSLQTRSRALALLVVLAAAPLLAFASPGAGGTWKWRDATGRVVYSDLPPPPGVRVTGVTSLNRGVPAEASSQVGSGGEALTRASGGSDAEPAPGKGSGSARGAGAASTAAANAGTGAPAGANAQSSGAGPGSPPGGAASSWVEREKASRKQAAARAEAERRQADEKRKAADKDLACAQATADLRALDSGLRLATVNKRGAPEPMDAVERARRVESTRRMLAENCSAARS